MPYVQVGTVQNMYATLTSGDLVFRYTISPEPRSFSAGELVCGDLEYHFSFGPPLIPIDCYIRRVQKTCDSPCWIVPITADLNKLPIHELDRREKPVFKVVRLVPGMWDVSSITYLCSPLLSFIHNKIVIALSMYRRNPDSPLLKKTFACHCKDASLPYEGEWTAEEQQQLLRMMGKETMSVDAMRKELQSDGVDWCTAALLKKEGNSQALRRTKHLFLAMISHLDGLVAQLVSQGDLIKVN